MYFKIKEAAKQLNVSRSFLYQAINEGRIGYHRFGKGTGGIRISELQIQEYLRKTERGGETLPAPEKVSASGFTMLDADRLKEAWQGH